MTSYARQKRKEQATGKIYNQSWEEGHEENPQKKLEDFEEENI